MIKSNQIKEEGKKMDENGEIFNALNLLKSYEMDNNAQDNEKPEKKERI